MDLAALAAGGVGSLFGYNRENYFFDGKQRIKRIYQGQTMRVKQFELFREDIRDLMNLTVAKMDNYLIVNTIQIGLVVVLFTEGRPKPGDAPPWLLFLWGASGVGSFMYIALCIWLAMHASICSHSYCVRILTQLVRLPIPTKEQLDAARVLATDFEGAEVREMLRFPVVKQQLKKLKTMVEQMEEEQLTEEATYGSDAASDPGEETMLDASGRPVQSDTLAHVKLYRRMQANWQAYDAYARVCMAMGTNQFLQQLGYTCLIGFISENHSVLPGICSVVIFSVCAALLVRLDLYLPLQHLVLAGILNTLPPMIAGVSLILDMLTLDGKSAYWKLLGDSLVPAAFFLHILWLGLLLVWAKGKVINNIYLPTIFRAVLYLDVFGWLSSEDRQESRTLTGAAEDENTADSFSGLSVVQEEEPSQPSRLRIPGSDGRRQSLRDSLAKLCGEMKSNLEKDLKCFEAEDVSSIMEPYEKQAIQELRQQLNDTVASVRLEEPGEATDESKPVWVRLEWNPSGRASYFYRQVRPEDPKVVWTRPLPPDQVLELDELRTRLEGLKKKVEMLASHFQDEQVTISFDASSCRSSNNSGEAEQLSHWPESASAGESHPAQDQTQAASEAVQLAESAAAMQAQAGAGFHPHQPRADSRPGPDRHQEPGLLPWTTVKQGSLILISAWGIGLVWSILRLWTDVVDILDPPKKPDNPDLELLFDGPWPRYFQPRGLACDERDRDEAPRILIAEKHEVHQLLQEEHWTLSTSSMEAACLSTQPRFHANGLRGISLQCAHEGCESVLVGEGSRALRCGGNETAELKLHGGPWHLATSLDQGVWATRPAESSPVLLHPGSDGWVPALQLAEHPAASDQRLLDRMQDGGLLAMSHAGRIHAWQPQASSSSWLPSGWSYDLPDDLGLSWTGLCTAGSSLILLGQAAGGKVEVWRLSLPALRGA